MGVDPGEDEPAGEGAGEEHDRFAGIGMQADSRTMSTNTAR